MCAAVKRAAERASCMGSRAIYLADDDGGEVKVCSPFSLLLLTSFPRIIVCVCVRVGKANSACGKWAIIGCIQRCHHATHRINIHLASCKSCSTWGCVQSLTIQTQIYADLSHLDKPFGFDHHNGPLDVSISSQNFYWPSIVTSPYPVSTAWTITWRIHVSQRYLCSVSNCCLQQAANHS